MQNWMLIHHDRIETGEDTLLSSWKQNTGSLLWIDIIGTADDADQELLEVQLGLPAAEVKDALLDRHPPIFSGNRDYLFLLLKPLDSESKTLDFNTQQMAIFGGTNFVVTRHNKHSNYLDSVRSEVLEGKLRITSPYQIFSLVTDRMVSRYGRIILNLEERLDTIEDDFAEDLDESSVQELVGYNTALRKMRRILSYHVGVTNQLTNYARKYGLDEWLDNFQEIASQAERFNSLAELYQNVINDLIEGYISLNSHHLNQVMKILTVVTVVFLPLSLLVGIYGMNFEYMPELKAPNGYFILISVMVGIASTLAYIFHRMKWL